MKRVAFASLTVMGVLCLTAAATAQGTGAPAAGPAPTAAPSAPPAAAPAQPAAAPDASADAQWSWRGGENANANAAAVAPQQPAPGLPADAERAWRANSLHLGTTIGGSAGLLRVSEAGAGAAGTFRLSLMSSYFTGSGFLCNSQAPCPSLSGEDPFDSDSLDHIAAHLALSVTVLPFLEAYAGIHNSATHDSRGRPQLLQVLGDTNLGVKAFLPLEPDQLFSFGGAAELWLLNGTGGVGVDGAGTSFLFRGLATVDLNNRLNPNDAIPLRFHTNLAYHFDNSSKVVESLETTPPPNGRGRNITRIERFGLGINRVDFVEFGIGGEFVSDVVRPFIEWTVDIPLNRQNYTCSVNQAFDDGEGCLGQNQGISTSPSRISLGARAFPWEDHGLGLLAAFDIGTSGTSKFIDEVAPELPWSFWFGIAYGVDTEPPKPIIQRVEAPVAVAPPAPVINYIVGTVVEKGTAAPVPDAVVKFDGRSLSGMVSGEDGSFRSQDLDPGTYTLSVAANGYRTAQCIATISPPGASGAQPAAPPAQPGVPAAPGQGLPGASAAQPGAPAPAAPGAPPAPGAVPAGQPGVPAPGTAPVPSNGTGSNIVRIQCELEALPKVGSVVGSLLDAETNAAVGGAHIKVTDKLNRQLELNADATGAFRFEQVPPGPLKFTIEQPGYFTNITEVVIRPREETQARILLNKRPIQPNVVIAGKEIKIKKQVHFQHDSAEILPDSMAILEELADVIQKRPDLKGIEVQGHTDDTGAAPYNLRLSQSRAQAVVDAIARLGIDPARLTAKGYGQDKPLVPNVTDANRAKNRRVQLMITDQGK